MNLHAHARRIVFLSALYDLVVTLPFATPWSARFTVARLADLHRTLGLSGIAPSFETPDSLLFATLMGSIVVVWSVLRLRAPTIEHGIADTAGRVLFSTWMAYALAHGASPVIGVLLLLEIGWGLVQGAAVLGRPATIAA
jgi:hypothetical protein